MKKFGTFIDDYAKGKTVPGEEVVHVVPTPYLQKRALFGPQISGKPSDMLNMIVVIPAKNEPRLIDSLVALRKTSRPDGHVEVIVVINDSEKDEPALKEKNRKLFEKAKKWGSANSLKRLKFHVLYHCNLAPKHAGVGLARKIGMDEAVYRFEGIGLSSGIIICFDADASCRRNYFKAIEAHFEAHPKTQACSIHYEHPLQGDVFPKKVYRAIALYELHLRYYTHAQRFTGFPFAHETIGSSMAVRADAYQQQGGMNRRKAGEDFYFLHKFTPLGQFTEINTTKVIPSPRRSDRVPFGTGKAVEAITGSPKEIFATYAPQSFIDLKVFFDQVNKMRKWTPTNVDLKIAALPKSVSAFLETIQFKEKLFEIIKNTAGAAAFRQRFFRWFNAFIIMKYVHFSRDKFHANVPVETASSWLLREYFKIKVKEGVTAKQLLVKMRKRHQAFDSNPNYLHKPN